MAPYQDAEPFSGVRTLRVDGTDDYNSIKTIIALPSVLPVVRPDGTEEHDRALMTGLGEYSLWITDDKLRALVDLGKMEIKVKWDEIDNGSESKSYRALCIHFVWKRPSSSPMLRSANVPPPRVIHIS